MSSLDREKFKKYLNLLQVRPSSIKNLGLFLGKKNNNKKLKMLKLFLGKNFFFLLALFLGKNKLNKNLALYQGKFKWVYKNVHCYRFS